MRMLRFALLCSFHLFLLSWVSAEQPVSFPVQWETVPSTPPEQRNLESPYLGECICDVTWGLCDPNCCCDSDCGVAERNMFSFCLQETFGSFPVDYCHVQKKDEVTHKGFSRYIDKTAGGHSALCIVRFNNVKGLIPFFTLPKNVLKPPDKKSIEWTEITKANRYEVNGGLLLMKRIEFSTSQFEMRNMGLFRIPSARRDGYCSLQGRRVRFMNPIDTTSCVLRGKDVCTFFPTLLYANLFLANPNKFSSQVFTPVYLKIFSDVSGKLVAAVDSNSSIPEAYQSVISGMVCKNAVARVRSSLLYSFDESGLILKNATTSLYIRDIEVEDIASLLFQVEFSHVGVVPPLNLFPATPGYFGGSRVRAGILVEKDGKKAIAERVAGFSIPSGGRSCYQNNYRKVSFLHDVRNSGCTVLISENELRKICSGVGTGKMLREILGINSKVSFDFDVETKPIDYVARTNDAQTNDTTSWIKIEGLDFDDISPGPYDSVRRECSNIYVGVHYRFVLSRVGAVSNAQDIIVAAFADPIIGKWRIHNTSDFTPGAVTAQRFRFLVSFAWADSTLQTTIHRKVVAPAILPRVDDTIFLPFKGS